MDEGNPATVGDAFATTSRACLTPLRAALLLAVAVLGGVVLSLVLGSSPAHAVENPGPGVVPPAPATSAAATALHGAIPGAQQLLTLGGRSLATRIPATDPVVTPLVAAVGTALTAVDHAVTPVVDGVLTLAAPPASRSSARPATAPVFSAPVLIGSRPANGESPVHAATSGSTGPLPSPVLTSSASASAAAACILFLTLLALALPGLRRRLRDDALPASPVFETDTSPA